MTDAEKETLRQVKAMAHYILVESDLPQERAEVGAAAIRSLLAEVERLRARAYKAKCAAPGSHSSACITWGDDGQGKGQENPNVCSCGAWPEWLKARIDAALAQLKRNPCDCREDDCHHCELVRLTVKALKGEQ